MQVLHVEGIRKYFGPNPVLDGVTFDLYAGDRAGLVGPNGSGKTTLLKIIAGLESPDGGECQITTGIRLGYLEQHAEFLPGRTVWEEAQSALQHLLELQHEAERTAALLAEIQRPDERARLAARFDRLQQELHRLNAYHLDHKIEQILVGLGLGPDFFDRPACELSGGEQNRLLLAKLLLSEPDFMLLDEPSNHLDIEATRWLEEFLANHRAAMIIVSHDRYFLDKVTTRTLELFRGTVETFPGNFSAYRRQKEERLLVARRTYEKQLEEIEKAEEFIRRHHYGQKAAQAQDRRKKLERIELVEPPREITAPPIQFPAAERSGDIVLRVENLGKSFGRPLFKGLTFEIARGQRWGILGPNGCGKSTLLKCLLGEVEPDEGRVIRGHNVIVGYFDQHLTCLPPDLPAMDAVLPTSIVGDDLVEQKRRDLLAKFGITGDRALTPVRNLSGGERCRVALARLTAAKANFLVLDEPTNHLDLWARDALEQALRRFDGTVLFVSHDRYFIDQVADHLLVFEGAEVRVIHGNYAMYQALADARRAESAQKIKDTAPDESQVRRPSKRADDRGEGSGKRKRRFPYRKVEDIEADILQHEARREEIHRELSEPETYRHGDRVKRLKQELEELEQKLQSLYAHWEEAMELNG
ncbi:ATPase components of ABC transporters with duplicated ATPase domains [Thermogutta terrifontis]|uniref:ATPase components of ABC transporters with duplicated ATPase domains n=1 Tax=Thermogutta terrifontis TaxID=1331910 RepID=A0A286RF26_9BACT|nr:ABC-F family ATP-binding cassette domain-containing protein [Thermogutta terrifontis]ASV74569.1 ATPase components of ABC transporters with duplicated ATPase domains [Thermogutta terrifontis]